MSKKRDNSSHGYQGAHPITIEIDTRPTQPVPADEVFWYLYFHKDPNSEELHMETMLQKVVDILVGRMSNMQQITDAVQKGLLMIVRAGAMSSYAAIG